MLSCSLCSFLLLLFYHPISGLGASTPAGTLKLYNDYGCNKPSTLNPTVTLPLDTCLVTTGGEGLVIAKYPPCPSSTASLIYYSDTACGVTNDAIGTSPFSSDCFLLASGSQLYNARAVMFACEPAADHPQPSSTTTAVVSRIAGVETGAAVTSQGSGSTTSTASPGPTQTRSDDGVGGNSDGSSSGNTSSNSTSSSTRSGLKTGDIIALAVGLGIGVPTIIIMLCTWLLPDFRHKLRGWMTGTVSHKPFRYNEYPQGQQQHPMQYAHQPSTRGQWPY